MDSVWYQLILVWGIFLLGFVSGCYWATRPRDDDGRDTAC